jgi:hypothetical protein
MTSPSDILGIPWLPLAIRPYCGRFFSFLPAIKKPTSASSRHLKAFSQIGLTATNSSSRPVRRGVSNGVEDGRSPPALRACHPRNGRKAVSGVACPQGVKVLSMAGPGETLESPWIPFAIRTCPSPPVNLAFIVTLCQFSLG